MTPHSFRILRFAALLLASASLAGAAGLEVAASAGRKGPCSATLSDGRSLIIGGGVAPQATVQFFERNGTASATTSMTEARWGHICVALSNHAVLVAGGFGQSNQPTNSAEIFNPGTGEWRQAASMSVARTGASAILLSDGRVLVSGGRVNGQPSTTMEMYDPAKELFMPVAGELTVPREGHTVAALADGRILIAGGAAPGGTVQDTTDIFEPELGRVMPGPRMLQPRTNFSATRLLDGKVLLAGGSDGTTDLASAEVLDPESGASTSTAALGRARQGHLAVLIPDNGRVLIEGGVPAAAATGTAEFYVPWRGVFEPAAAGAAGRGGKSIIMGRVDANGKLISTATYASPTLQFSRNTVAAGAATIVEGWGWRAGEEVKLQQPRLNHTTVVADAQGRISALLPAQTGSVTACSATGDAGVWLQPDSVRQAVR